MAEITKAKHQNQRRERRAEKANGQVVSQHTGNQKKKKETAIKTQLPKKSALQDLKTENARLRASLEKEIRDHKVLKESAIRQTQALTLLDRVRATIASKLELPELLRSVVESIVEVYGYTHVSVYMREGDVLQLQHQVGYKNIIETIRLNEGISGRVARTGKPVLIEDVKQTPEFLEAIEGLASEITVPLKDNNQIVGTLSVESKTKLTKDDLKVMVALSADVSVAIGRVRLYEDVQKRNRTLSALQESTLAIMGELSLLDASQAILAQAAQLLNTSHGYIYLVQPDQKLQMVTGMGIYLNYIGIALESGEGLAGKVWKFARPVIANDYAHWKGRTTKFNNVSFQAVIGVPLLHNSQVIGVLGLAHLDPGLQFTDADTELLSRLAQLASIAIDNAALYTQVHRELADRKQAEQALGESEEKYRNLVEHTPAIVYLDNADKMGTNFYISPQVEKILGYPPSAFANDPTIWHRLIHPDDYERTVATIAKTITNNQNIEEYRMIAKDGRVVWIRDTSVLIRDEEGHPKYIQGFLDDITEHKQAEYAFRKSEQRLQAFFNQSLDGFFFCDFEEPIEWRHAQNKDEILEYIITTKHFTDVNEAMLQQYGIDRETFLSLTTKDVFAHDLEQGRNLRRELFDKGHLHLETTERTAHGAPVWFEGDYVCLYDSRDRVTGFFGIQRDITERKQAESELRRHIQNTITMYELSQNIHTSLDLDLVYQETHQAIQKLMPCDAFLIALLDKNNQMIDDVYLWDQGKRWNRERHPLGEGLTNYIISTGKPLFVNEWTDAHTQLTRTLQFGDTEMDTNSVLAVPLFAMDGSCFGMMTAQAYPANAYTSEHEQLLITLANQVSKAIENANLFTTVQQELTERNRTEQALRESEERYRTLFDGMLDGVYRSTHDGKFVDVNPAMVKMFGYASREEMLKVDIKKDLYFSPEERNSLFLDTGQEKVDEFRMKRKDGSEIWVEDHGRYVHDKDGNVIYHEGILRDITERKHTEDALRRSEAFTKSIIENEPECVKIVGAGGQLQYMNPAGLAMIEADSLEALVGKSIYTIIAEKDRKAFIELTERVMRGEQGTLRFEITGLKGTRRWLDTHSVPLYDEHGTVTALLGLTRDITERMRAAEAVREAEEKYRSIFENAVEGIYQSSPEGRFYTVNPAFASMIGYDSPQEMMLNITDIASQLYNDANRRQDFINQIEEKDGVTGFEYQMRRKDGRLLWVSENARLVRDADGNALYYEGILEDITARKQNEQRIDNQLKQLNALHAIDNAINSNFDLRTTLDVVLREVIAQLRADATSVLLFNKETHTLDYTAGRGFISKATQHTKLSVGEGYAGRIILDRKMIHIPDLTKTENNRLTDALNVAGENFVAYVGSPLIAKGQVVGVLEIFQRAPLIPDPDWFDFLTMIADQAAIAIDNAQLFENLQRSNFELTLAYDATIEGWSRALDLRDRETEGHTQRVTNLTVKLARQMGIPDSDILHIRRGALLHDIGKMGIPDNILHKPDQLTAEEWAVMRQHTNYAYQMLTPIKYLKQALDIPRYHHEKWDGTGYPNGLKGEQIPIAARIFAVVDVWDAITSDRSYRDAWTKQKAIEYIRTESGKHFDPKVAETFLSFILHETP